jgi:hypothetical protein
MNVYKLYYDYLSEKGLETEYNNFIMEYTEDEIRQILKRNNYIK